MAKCKYCDATISRLDTDICPFCGHKDPISISYETMDMTDIEQQKKIGNLAFNSAKKKKVYLLFLLFCGLFGLHNFYLGKSKRAAANIISTILVYLAIALPLFFTVYKSFLAFIFPLIGIYCVYILNGILSINKSIKDKDGVYIR